MVGVAARGCGGLGGGSRWFPKTVCGLKGGKLWLRDAIEEFGQRWDRKPGRPDRSALVRQRVTSAVLDAGITAADTEVFLGQERTVILHLAAHGSPQVRQRTAARVVSALSSVGLGVTDEGSHSAEDMKAYLAAGGTAEVFELAEEQITVQRV